ncbi:hypothetical protein BASA83_011096 [Batrachochytrium salamandrivorans]|nr:hypothetical protein BASA83_011096 [Batrachochytrium salamandrivorans]
MHQHRQQDSTFADPVQLATVCVSLLHDEAYEALLAISSEFIKDRYTLLFRPSTPSPLRFFTWQSDNIKAILEMCDVRLNPPAPESARYKMWDSETLQAAVPFGANSSHIRNDSGFGMSNPLIQKDTPTPELLLPFGPSAMGASTRDTYRSQSRGLLNHSMLMLKMKRRIGIHMQWLVKTLQFVITPIPKLAASDDEDDSYWNSYV